MTPFRELVDRENETGPVGGVEPQRVRYRVELVAADDIRHTDRNLYRCSDQQVAALSQAFGREGQVAAGISHIGHCRCHCGMGRAGVSG